MRPLPTLLAFLLLAATFAGCLGAQTEPETTGAPADRTIKIGSTHLDGTGFVKVTVLEDGVPVRLASTGPDGQTEVDVPPGADAIALTWKSGATQVQALPPTGDIADVVERDELLDASTTVPLEAELDARPELGLVPVRLHDFGSVSYPAAVGTSCLPDPASDPSGFVGALGNMDCGISEPTIEVAGDGTVYYSAVCCIGGAPPIWVSRDDGASWDTLDSDHGHREAFGIEGDFAIDDAGNVYFFDIELANIQVSAWDKDGNHMHTVHWTSPPLVDRPWVRAEGDGIVYLVYNQGIGKSTFMRSTDHGLTFPATEWRDIPFLFGNLARGTAPGELWMTGDRGTQVPLWYSDDGGLTWREDHVIETPGNGSFGNRVMVVDTAGTPYVFFDDRAPDGTLGDEEDGTNGGYHIYYSFRGANGTWSEPIMVGPVVGSHYFPWPAAAGPGHVAVAWYGTLDDTAGPNDVADGTPWHLYLSVSLDADQETPHWQTIVADPQPLLTGPVDRRLLDFVQTDIGPDGAIHVGYAHDPDDDGRETSVYLQTAANLPLVDPLAGILNGPRLR